MANGHESRQVRRARQRAAEKRVRRLRRGIGVAAGLGALAIAGPAMGITVTNSGDDFGTGDGCTLREAVQNASTGVDVNTDCGLTNPQTVDFDDSVTLVTLANGDVRVTGSITIDGGGTVTVTTNDDPGSRIFDIGTDEGVLDVTVKNITLQGGDASGGNGGGILAQGSGLDLTVDNATITGNQANAGGGIAFEETGTLTITHSTISGNTAGGEGGGVESTQPTSISDSTFSGNYAYYGGGLYASGTGLVTVQRSTFDSNHAGFEGGGIFDHAPLHVLATIVSNNVAGEVVDAEGFGGGIEVAHVEDFQLDDSVVTGNVADPADVGPAGDATYNDYGSGGGIFAYQSASAIRRTTLAGNTAAFGGGMYVASGSMTLENVTVAGNHAASTEAGFANGGGLYAYSEATIDARETTITGNDARSLGGGISVDRSSAVTLHDDIVANNTGNSAADVRGTVTATYTLIEDQSNTTIEDGTGNLPAGTDPQLGALADNGSTILAGDATHGTAQHPQTAMQAGTSPVVNAGDPAFAPPPTTDERGFARVDGGRIDMGAVEVASSLPDLIVSKTVNGSGPFVPGSFVSYTVAVTNQGTGDAPGVVVTDTIPASTTYSSAQPSQGSCSGTSTVTCDLGTIAAGGTATITLTVIVHSTGPVDNTAVATTTATDSNPANNSGTASIAVAAAEPVPTLGEWAMGLLAGLLGMLGVSALRRSA